MPKAERFLSIAIRLARESRGLTQAQLAERCRPPVRQHNVSQWESGARPLSEASLEKVADALRVSVRELLAEAVKATALETTSSRE